MDELEPKEISIDKIRSTWDLEAVKSKMNNAFDNNSELDLLAILKSNSFLFYELYDRRYRIRPAFHEVSFDGSYKCDFAWLNDKSSGPEWVLLEVEKPKMKLFKIDGDPSKELNHAIEQVKKWRSYFDRNPGARRRIFGAVAEFRYILVAGCEEDWLSSNAVKWRIDHHKHSSIEVHSTSVFKRALKYIEDQPGEFWSFAYNNPITYPPSELQKYWDRDDYIGKWRRIIDF